MIAYLEKELIDFYISPTWSVKRNEKLNICSVLKRIAFYKIFQFHLNEVDIYVIRTNRK